MVNCQCGSALITSVVPFHQGIFERKENLCFVLGTKKKKSLNSHFSFFCIIFIRFFNLLLWKLFVALSTVRCKISLRGKQRFISMITYHSMNKPCHTPVDK